MKVKLLKPFCSRKVGDVVTMHPINARMYYKMGVCEALSEEDKAYFEKEVLNRGHKVETQAGSKATEAAVITSESDEPVAKARGRKPKGTSAKRKK